MELISGTQEIVIILENQSIRNLDLSNVVKNHTIIILLSRNLKKINILITYFSIRKLTSFKKYLPNIY